ncbi:MAG: hypothetical protein SNJ70_09890 [Armatimonadota bacterium]
MNKKLLESIVIILLFALLINGCGGGGLLSGIINVTSRTLLPSNWSSAGGIVTIIANVAGFGIEDVVAYVLNRQTNQRVPIVLSRERDGSWSGRYRADENNSNEPIQYEIIIEARDNQGNTIQSEPEIIEVPAADNE